MSTYEERRQNYLSRIGQINLTRVGEYQKSPQEILAEGVRLSTKITEPRTVEQLTEKAMNAEAYAKEGGHDVFLFGIAESLENTRCGTTSQNEYFGWIDEGKRIMRHMRDGFVSFQDLHERDDFIKMSWQREAELLVCLALYEKSDHPQAKVRYAELLLKLQRLRQIRSALLVGTNNKADQRPFSEAERSRMLSYLDALDGMEEYDSSGDYHNLHLLQELQMLGISHMNDAEFYYGGYSFYLRMLEEQRRIIAQKREKEEKEEKEKLYEYLNQPDEYVALVRHQSDTREQVRRRIQELSGRKLSRYNLRAQGQSVDLRMFRAQRYRDLCNNS